DFFRSVGAVSGSAGGGLRLPEVGEELFGFRLREQLGRGAFARVYLAEQADLAGRPVVLKVSAIDGDEPQTLAQLQHTNIVPIYSAPDAPAAGSGAVCMPSSGGASLSAVLQRLRGGKPPAAAADFLRALAAAAGPEDAGRHAGSGPHPPLYAGWDYL